MQVTNHGLVIGSRRNHFLGKMCRIGTVIIRALSVLFVCFITVPQISAAQDLSALAKLDPVETSFGGYGSDIDVVLALSQPVPWRARLLADPPRLVMDFREVNFEGIATVRVGNAHIKSVRAGIFRPGWSRLVLELDGPFMIELAEMATGDAKARVDVKLVTAAKDVFARVAALAEPAEWALPKPTLPLSQTDTQNHRLVVVLDPGHGGIDPGAERNGQSEAALMLAFARQLKELLLRDGIFDVVMTRDDDIFVPLETRISIARAENADVLISLHADALEEGQAVGAVIYTLSSEASDVAASRLAERHDRDDLLAGVNLAGQDDLVATVLMDMARTETAPRTARLATAFEQAMLSSDIKMHRIPLQSAGFSVLKSPDIPSVLIELGFLSSAPDFARLTDAKWQARMAQAIRDGLAIWAQEDAALQGLQRK